MSENKDYESYPQGFSNLVEDMFIPNIEDKTVRENVVFNMITELIGA